MLIDTERNPTAADGPPREAVADAAVESYRQRIHASCQKGISGVFEVAAICHEANATLLAKEKKALRESKLPFSKANFAKYAKIGGDERLLPLIDILPPNFSLIYEISLLSADQLKQAIDSNTIHTTVHRKDIVALRKPPATAGGGKSSKPTAVKIDAGERYHLKMPANADEEACDLLGAALAKLKEKFRIEIEPAEAAAFEDFQPERFTG
jgi:hypothetical protein